jgi:beta-glucanase (GH16 family)
MVQLQPRDAADRHPLPAPFDQPFHLLVNLAVGGGLPGPPDESTRFPAELAVDYIRVYERMG